MRKWIIAGAVLWLLACWPLAILTDWHDPVVVTFVISIMLSMAGGLVFWFWVIRASFRTLWRRQVRRYGLPEPRLRNWPYKDIPPPPDVSPESGLPRESDLSPWPIGSFNDEPKTPHPFWPWEV